MALLDATGLKVLGDSNEVVASGPNVLLGPVVCKYVPYFVGLETIVIFLVVRVDKEDTVAQDALVPGVVNVVTLNLVEKSVGIYDAVGDNKLIFVDTPGVNVLCEPEKEGPSVI